METEDANEVEATHVIPEKEDEELEMLAQALAAGVVMGEVERRLWRILERIQEKETEKVVDEVLVRAWELAGNAEEARWQQDVYGMVDRWRQAGALSGQKTGPRDAENAGDTNGSSGQKTGPGQIQAPASKIGQKSGPVPVHDPDKCGRYKVTEVEAGSPMARAGVQEGEIIIAVNDMRMPDTLRYFLTHGYRTRHHREEEVVVMWVAGEGGLRRVEAVPEEKRKGRERRWVLGVRAMWLEAENDKAAQVRKARQVQERAKDQEKEEEEGPAGKSKRRRKRRQMLRAARQDLGEWTY